MIKINEDLRRCDTESARQILEERPEDVFLFLYKNDDIYNHFCKVSETEDISMAEYIWLYRWQMFVDFLLMEY